VCDDGFIILYRLLNTHTEMERIKVKKPPSANTGQSTGLEEQQLVNNALSQTRSLTCSWRSTWLASYCLYVERKGFSIQETGVWFLDNTNKSRFCLHFCRSFLEFEAKPKANK
jgi:hypothetical protein